MAEGRWDVPQTEEGLRTLLGRLEESRAAGDEAAVGHGLLALAWPVKWVRSDNEEPRFVRAGTLATEAIEIFRRIGDERGLLAALRAPSVFLGPEETDRRLTEATQIAERLGDRLEIARTLAARGRALGFRGREAAQQALVIFRELGDKAGQAGCLFSLSVKLDTDEEKHHAVAEAAPLYREIGDVGMAAKCAWVAVMYGASFRSYIDMEDIARQGLADAIAYGSDSTKAISYGHLTKVAAAKGDTQEAVECLRARRALEERNEGLNSAERRQNDVRMTKTLIAMSRVAGNPEGVALFEAELRRLRRRKPKGEP